MWSNESNEGTNTMKIKTKIRGGRTPQCTGNPRPQLAQLDP